MSIVNHLVNDFVDEDKILADGLFVKHATVVTEHLHHAVNDVHDKTGRHVVLRRRYKEDAELLGEKVIQPVDILTRSVHLRTYEGGRRITLPQIDFAIEDLACFAAEVLADWQKESSEEVYLQSRKMIVSPLPLKIKNWDNI